MDDRGAAPVLAGALDVDRHVEAPERVRAAGGVEDVDIDVALVVEVDRRVGGRAVRHLVRGIALAGRLAVAGQVAEVLPRLAAVERLVGADLEEVLGVVLVHLRAGHEVVVVQRVHRDRRLGVRRVRVARGAVVLRALRRGRLDVGVVRALPGDEVGLRGVALRADGRVRRQHDVERPACLVDRDALVHAEELAVAGDEAAARAVGVALVDVEIEIRQAEACRGDAHGTGVGLVERRRRGDVEREDVATRGGRARLAVGAEALRALVGLQRLAADVDRAAPRDAAGAGGVGRDRAAGRGGCLGRAGEGQQGDARKRRGDAPESDKARAIHGREPTTTPARGHASDAAKCALTVSISCSMSPSRNGRNSGSAPSTTRNSRDQSMKLRPGSLVIGRTR